MLAYIPGLVIGFMAATLIVSPHHVLLLDPPPGRWPVGEWPCLTVVVAAWNEESVIETTLERLVETTYPGDMQVVLADNNSTDRTAEVAEAVAVRLGLAYRRVFEPEPGKFHALNTVLDSVETPLVVTVDADTYLYPDALTYLAARVTDRPQDQHVCACAGALVVENAAENFLTRMQQWDYRLGINGVKRMQAAYNSALVAQGAFSIYWTEDVRDVGGWPDAIGEDIVLTWTMMEAGGLSSTNPSPYRPPPCPPDSATSCASAPGGPAACSRGSTRTHPSTNHGSSPRPLPASTTSSPSWTSATSSSGSPA